jgi:MFS transporter, DHA1 family, tetracycline resistance protein
MKDSSKPSKSALMFILGNAFLTAMGFGIVLPVLPYIVAEYVSPQNLAATVGWLAASYAICSFFAAPVLGALSDVWGRRPVLLLSLLGSAVGYVLFGLGGALWMLFLGRIIDGLTAGSFSALSAYLADVTAPEERGRYFGLIGATVGAGFILGPALGGLVARFGLQAPVFVAAGLTILNMLWGFVFMKDTRARESKAITIAQLNPFTTLAGLLNIPHLRGLLLVGFLFMLPFAAMQGTLTVLAKDALAWGPDRVSILYTAVGVSDIVVQGLLFGWLIRKLGEKGVATLGLCLNVAGLVGMAFLPHFSLGWLLIVSVVGFAIGEGIFTASLGTLLSRAADSESQGKVQGGSQSMQSLAQIAGPLAGGQMYSRLGASVPFWSGAALVLTALFLLGGQRVPSGGLEPEAAEL